MFIDTHCHLNFEAFKNDLPRIIKRAREVGVGHIVIPGTDIASSIRAIEIAQKYPDCWAAIGIHPHHAKDTSLLINNELKNTLSKLLSQNRVVAMGEIGLDYHTYDKSKRYVDVKITPELKQKQKDLFLMQVEIAHEQHKPIIFHCREAYDDMIQTISTFSRNRENSTLLPVKPFSGVFHCFGGSKQNLRLLISMGYYIGFDGNITYSPDWSTFVSSTPLSHLLLETDSPFLAPIPHRGEQNEPAYLPMVAEAVAQYQGVSVEEVRHSSTENAKKLFGLS